MSRPTVERAGSSAPYCACRACPAAAAVVWSFPPWRSRAHRDHQASLQAMIPWEHTGDADLTRQVSGISRASLQPGGRRARSHRHSSHLEKVHKKPTYPGEVRVRGGHGSTMLHRTCCDPRIVGRDRGSCGSQLINDGSIMLCGSLGGNDEADSLFGQERFELRSVSCLAASSSKPGKELTDNDRRDQDQRCFPHSAYSGRGSSHGMAVDSRVEENWCHFQSSGSSLRCSDRALENSSNSSRVQVPNKSSRS